jgi:hypothetical protein
MNDAVRRIAMWSGPRNISTALMRAWENRGDTIVVDEPFYAHYLVKTGLDHPGRDEVIASQDSDWRHVAARLTGPVESDASIFYQKHMAHHCLPGMLGDWMDSLTHVFLIRDPVEIVASYTKSREQVEAKDLGLHRQVEIRDFVAERTGEAPLVVDGNDVLKDPEGMLRALCDRLGLPFDEAMLSWPAGPRDSDGVWAPYWYDNVSRSTGFIPYTQKVTSLDAHEEAIAEHCREPYESLGRQRLIV